MDAIAESLVNTFTKVHKPDKRFIEVSERAGKLTEDLNNVEKVTVRVARRQADLEQDYADLATQCQKLTTLEPAVESTLTSFAASVTTTGRPTGQPAVAPPALRGRRRRAHLPARCQLRPGLYAACGDEHP